MLRPMILALALMVSLPAHAAPLDDLIADYEAFALADDPISAGQEGDRAALSRLPDVTPAADLRRKTALTGFRARLSAVSPDGLTPEAALNRAFLAWTIDERLQSLAFDEARLPFNSDGGFQSTMGYLVATTPIRSVDDARAWIDRLTALPAYYDANIENARRGAKAGFTQPRSTVEAVLAQARRTAQAPVEGDVLLGPLAQMPDTISAADQAALRVRASSILVDQIRPRQRAFADFLERDYLPRARAGLGARSLPGGEAYYRWLVHDQTTTNLSPDDIHAIGQSEVARLRGEMDVAIRQTGFDGDFTAFVAMLRKDPRFYATSRQDLLEKASEIAKRIDDQLPAWFATLPRLTYGVRPVPADIEETYTTGRYFSGSPRQGVAGGYMVNTSHLDQRPLYELPALTLHEAVPGHHLQIALGQELEGVPAFRRNAGVTAFTEGWGLYSETLGGEMGIYRDAYERFGKLSYEMWRACRLVADTGLHWKGWSLEQARACFTQNTALSPLNIEVELARYVSWPGQALAYKTGELKILALRSRARTALGERFDIRRFHDAVLLAGPLPLEILEPRIDAWIAAEKAR